MVLKKYTGIGIMSGTSHDGLDLACCIFTLDGNKWSFDISHAETIPYTDEWKFRLMGLTQKKGIALTEADQDLGYYIGRATHEFIKKYSLKPDFVASHGHTIFHEPDKGLTLQIGSGIKIFQEVKTKVIHDFRSSDVAMGGQGAPLVPIGDRLLFGDYDYCLNIGGIANISYEDGNQRTAFDICPANMVLNFLSEKMSKPYDDKGRIASKGSIIPALLKELEVLPYYKLSGPRSLGRERVDENIFPLLEQYKLQTAPDLLATFTEHIALRVAAASSGKTHDKMLVSGGGAYNDFLIQRMKHHCSVHIEVPDSIIIDFKEALIFAFLGMLRLEGINNVLGSVTGSGKDHCAGEVLE